MNPERASTPGRDATGKHADQRYFEIVRCFFELLNASGVSRTVLYSRPKPGDAREPTEQEVVQRWAETLGVSVNDISIGIQRAFAKAAERGDVVTSFRYCVPHIVARCQELQKGRSGLSLSATSGAPRVKEDAGARAYAQQILDDPNSSERDRQLARRALGASRTGAGSEP